MYFTTKELNHHINNVSMEKHLEFQFREKNLMSSMHSGKNMSFIYKRL